MTTTEMPPRVETERPWWRPPAGGDELTEWRLRIYPRFAIIGPLSAFILVMFQAARSEQGTRLGGDLPAFYGAGRIALAGNWDNLYDADTQIASQATALPDVTEGFLPFAYAPPVAAAYAPLASLEYRYAFLVHTCFMLACVIGGLWLLRPLSGLIRRRFLLVATMSATFIPMFRSVVGGQNSAFSFLLIAMILRLLAEERDIALAIPFTLLLYKPQLAIPIMGLCLVARRWRAVGASVLAVGTFWIVGALFAGAEWFGTWWATATTFGSNEEIIGADINVSWLGTLADVFGPTGWPAWLGWMLIGGTVLVLMQSWRVDVGLPITARAALLAPGLILISPHAMFYEAGILILSAVFTWEHEWARRSLIGGFWLYAVLELTSLDFGVHVIFPLVVATFGFIVTRLDLRAA